jgi:hypothetical protein
VDTDRQRGQDRPAPPGVPSDNTTLQEVLRRFAADGWASHLWLDRPAKASDAMVRCGRCGQASEITAVKVTAVRRLEGASDPADMLAVLAVACPACGTEGAMVLHYGPEADESETRLLVTAVNGGGEDRRSSR